MFLYHEPMWHLSFCEIGIQQHTQKTDPFKKQFRKALNLFSGKCTRNTFFWLLLSLSSYSLWNTLWINMLAQQSVYDKRYCDSTKGMLSKMHDTNSGSDDVSKQNPLNRIFQKHPVWVLRSSFFRCVYLQTNFQLFMFCCREEKQNRQRTVPSLSQNAADR